MFVVIQRRTLATVAALVILAIVVGWAVRAEREPSDAPVNEAAEGHLEETAPMPHGSADGVAGASVPVVASPQEGVAVTRGETNPSQWPPAVERAGAGVSVGLEPYLEARLARDRARSRRIELLTEVVLGSDASEDRKRTSQQELDAILRRAEVEVVSEGIIRNQGFSNPLVFAGEESVSVVVSETLSPDGAARIGEAVARVAGVPRGSVVIVDGGNVAAAQIP